MRLTRTRQLVVPRILGKMRGDTRGRVKTAHFPGFAGLESDLQVAASLRRQLQSGGVNTMFLRPSWCEALRIPCLSYTLGLPAIANTKI